MSSQVHVRKRLDARPLRRIVVALGADGPRLIGPVRPGPVLGRAPLELLVRLAGTEPDDDASLLADIGASFDANPVQLRNITERFRAAPPTFPTGADHWSPPPRNPASPVPPVFDSDSATMFAVQVPLLVQVLSSGFEHVNHQGEATLQLTAHEFSALRHLTSPGTIDELAARMADTDDSLESPRLLDLLHRLSRARLLRQFTSDDPSLEVIYHEDATRQRQADRVTQSLLSAVADANLRNPRRTDRIAVVPVHFDWSLPPLSLGFLFASARVHNGGGLNVHYDFRPDWMTDPDGVVINGPAVLLFSHYIWSSEQMLAYSARVKSSDPSLVTIHGGPDVPKYEPDVLRYFADHPYVDVAVHGEGEVTICEILEALAPALSAGGRADLDVLRSVPGLSYRGSDGQPVRTADRPRIVELDEIPSPFLTGEFDVFAAAGVPGVVLETNRGCPYGCTFCDWGSATASRIRKFDLDRVFAELDWCARHEIRYIGFADANFGIFERDVAIAERAAALKGEFGFPHHLGTNYAKNTVKHLKPIVEILVEADILAMGLLSLQSMDEETLSVIQRSNIKLDKYEALAKEFRANDLPLYVDLMMGLPGSTITSFQNDLQECIDREVYPKIHPTQLLVNSPMNDPAYRERYGITAAPSEFLTSCASFTEDDYEAMRELRRLYLLAEKFGILRHVLRYARHETGTREIDLLDDLIRASQTEPDRWPAIHFTFEFIPALMVPPVDWVWFLDDLHRYFIEELGLADDTALDSALRAQHAMIPAPERSFPDNVDLPCDYAAWHADVLAAKEDGHLDDWPEVVAPLRSYGAGTLEVTDPNRICTEALGRHFNSGVWSIWELSASIARPSAGALVALE